MAGADTRCGRSHETSEDSLFVAADRGVFVVSDGIGGFPLGDRASAMTCDEVARLCERRGAVSISDLDEALSRAHRAIWEMAYKRETQIGCTVAGLLFDRGQSKVWVLHAGDSRAYLFRNGKLEQLTEDHALGATGLLRHLGRSHLDSDALPPLNVEIPPERDAHAGDRYILCSDGILDHFTENEKLSQFLADHAGPEVLPMDLARALNDAALTSPELKDDLSVIVVDCFGSDLGAYVQRYRRPVMLLAAVAAALVFAVVGPLRQRRASQRLREQLVIQVADISAEEGIPQVAQELGEVLDRAAALPTDDRAAVLSAATEYVTRRVESHREDLQKAVFARDWEALGKMHPIASLAEVVPDSDITNLAKQLDSLLASRETIAKRFWQMEDALSRGYGDRALGFAREYAKLVGDVVDNEPVVRWEKGTAPNVDGLKAALARPGAVP